jgi:hypothetical protein
MRVQLHVAVAAAWLASVPSQVRAASPASRFTRASSVAESAGVDVGRPGFVPLGVSGSQVTVMLELRGDPVAVVRANAAAPLTSDQKEQVKAQLRARQAPVEQEVQARGGIVLGRYQSAYNGVKVRIAAA